MLAKRLFVLIAATAILFLQVQSCMSDPISSPQDMRCCKSMPCTPQNHNQGCCKNMVSPQAPNMLPAQHDSLASPLIAAIEYPRTLDLARWTDSVASTPTHVQLHSPPELYTLHAALLI
jgi:hypothetical protein